MQSFSLFSSCSGSEFGSGSDLGPDQDSLRGTFFTPSSKIYGEKYLGCNFCIYMYDFGLHNVFNILFSSSQGMELYEIIKAFNSVFRYHFFTYS